MRYLLVLLCSCGFVAAAQPDPSAEDLKALQGEWDMISIIHDGKNQDLTFVTQGAWRFDGDKLRYLNTADDVYELIEVDATKSPKTMKITMKRPDMPDAHGKAIYKLEGNKLIVNVVWMVDDFPTTFESTEGSKARLFTLERSVKK
jgi:uncharacterized protein (TIGR03067 family)